MHTRPAIGVRRIFVGKKKDLHTGKIKKNRPRNESNVFCKPRAVPNTNGVTRNPNAIPLQSAVGLREDRIPEAKLVNLPRHVNFSLMQLLKDVIAALCREIDSGLSSNRTQLQGRPLQTDRVTLSLQVRLKEHVQADGSTKPIFEVLSSDSQTANGPYSVSTAEDSQAHQVTIELKPATAGQPTPLPAADFSTTQQAPQTSEHPDPGSIAKADQQSVTEQLAEVFGEPGFDSSARATVFREAMGGLSHHQARKVLDALHLGLPPESDDPAVRDACHRIGNVFRSGPQESEPFGAKVVSALLDRYSVASLLRLIEEKWKTQDEWMGL
jgi:hypothetical protein